MLLVKEKAAELQQLIFLYQQADFEEKMVEFIDLMGSNSYVQTNEPIFLAVLHALLTAFQQKDYLLFADVLEYKLQPLCTK